MNADEVRALAREEIRKAFEELSERADFWRDDGELKSSAAYVLSDAADQVAEKLLPPAPEPVNPFSPKHTAQEWADRIGELIRQADRDGGTMPWVTMREAAELLAERHGPEARNMLRMMKEYSAAHNVKPTAYRKWIFTFGEDGRVVSVVAKRVPWWKR